MHGKRRLYYAWSLSNNLIPWLFLEIQYCAKVMQTKIVEIRYLFPRIVLEFSEMFRSVLKAGFHLGRSRSD